jgi:hypothetical protein
MLAVADPPWKINSKVHLPGKLPGSYNQTYPTARFNPVPQLAHQGQRFHGIGARQPLG